LCCRTIPSMKALDLREGYGIAVGIDWNGTTELLRIDPEMLRRPAVKILAFECRRLRMSCTIWPGYSKTSRSGSRPLCSPPSVALYLSVFTAHYTFGRGASFLNSGRRRETNIIICAAGAHHPSSGVSCDQVSSRDGDAGHI
jgi:hypothetical protein